MFSKLRLQLIFQVKRVNKIHPTLGRVEILHDDSKKYKDGGPTIGQKDRLYLTRLAGICLLLDDE